MKLDCWISTEALGASVSGLFSVSGDFGIIDGNAVYLRDGNTFSFENHAVALRSQWEQLDNGVLRRRDSLINRSQAPITLNRLFSRFTLEGSDEEWVYTQFNGWHHENLGQWQPLVSQVVASCGGIRACEGATPMMALQNRLNGQISVFHLLANAQWKITASRRNYAGPYDCIVVEAGFEDSGLAMTVEPGEEILLPELLVFHTRDESGLGCSLLHDAFDQLYPRKHDLPVLYNSWMMNFDYFTTESIQKQVDIAADLGVEMFLIDAGWFGSLPRWHECIGDWVESKTFGFKGDMAKVSQYVRDKGMRFGLWLEPERALEGTPIVQEHPEYFLGGMFLNFANEEALQYIFQVTCQIIDTYHVTYMKFDFNANLPYDPDHAAYYRYLEGQARYVQALHERYPELYLTNCASGGQRMELGQARLFDSFWPSDNQGLADQLRICTDGLKRLPPWLMERYLVLTFGGDFPQYQGAQHRALPLACNNACWDSVMSFEESYLTEFLAGGPLGFSCDLTAFPEAFIAKLKEHILAFKKARNFTAHAKAHILCQGKQTLCIEYISNDDADVLIQCFCLRPNQQSITVFPILDADTTYVMGESCSFGNDLMENGIVFSQLHDVSAQHLWLHAVH